MFLWPKLGQSESCSKIFLPEEVEKCMLSCKPYHYTPFTWYTEKQRWDTHREGSDSTRELILVSLKATSTTPHSCSKFQYSSDFHVGLLVTPHWISSTCNQNLKTGSRTRIFSLAFLFSLQLDSFNYLLFSCCITYNFLNCLQFFVKSSRV